MEPTKVEKSFATDPVGVHRGIAAAEAVEKKGVKIAAGLIYRHSPNREELVRRLRAGELGDLQFTRRLPYGARRAAWTEAQGKNKLELNDYLDAIRSR